MSPGRSTSAAPGNLPGTVEQAAAEVTAAGGRGIAVRCDHRDDAQVAAVFARVLAEQGRIDVLVNNAFGSPPQSVLWGGGPFWTLPIPLWNDVIDVGALAFRRRSVPSFVGGEFGPTP
jgi:dehydrogenase/reductase SDR family protein 1